MADTTLLSGIFEPGLLHELEAHALKKTFEEGTVLLHAGQSVTHIPLILSGVVKIFRTEPDGRELLLYYVNPLESCAMTFTCCMQEVPSEITAIVEERAEVLLIPIDLMDQWIMKFRSWKSFVMKTMRYRFNEMLRTIDQLAFQRLDERLIVYLGEKSRTSGSALLHVSHEQIAAELATSRVVISRLLKKLEQEGLLLLYRNEIKLLSTFFDDRDPV